MDENFDDQVVIWRNIIKDKLKIWVLFEYGTCVIIKQPENDIQSQAKELLKKWGPVVPGTSAGDFNVIDLDNNPGWVVLYHQPDIMNYVSPEEIIKEFSEELLGDQLTIGLYGRKKRHEDAMKLNILHVEDKRT
ncbi:MAG: hypothetical protein FK731_00170 [Asgard group archaeon]|nr:hypothetical protein [Asgard group archaeon]